MSDSGCAEVTALYVRELLSEIARLKAIMLDEDLILDALLDSMDVDWTLTDGARAVAAAFRREINEGETK